MATDVQDTEAPEAPAPVGEGEEKPGAPKARKRAAAAPNRAASTMPGRRQQFAWAAEAVEASSILASTWLERPAAEVPDGPCKVLALFYFRQPKQGHKKHQVFQVTRTEAGEIKVKRLGEGEDAVETYREHYSPVIQDLRRRRREAREKAKAGRPKRQRKPAAEADGQPTSEAAPTTDQPAGDPAPAL